MSSCVYWSAVDEHGDNPTGLAGNFEFRIWYEINYGDEDFMEEPSVEITAIDCVEVAFDGYDARSPNDYEDIELSAWLETSLDSNSADIKGIEHLAFEYSYVDCGTDDWLD